MSSPGRHRSRRRAVAAVVMMCVMPVLLAACALTGSSRAVPGVAASGPSQTLYVKGSAVPSAVPAGVPYPAASAVVVKPPSLSPASQYPVSQYPAGGYCPGQINQGKLDGLSVTAGFGSATVTWYSADNVQVLWYRLTSVSQKLQLGIQPSPPSVKVTPAAAGCGQVSTTVTGLTHQTYYVFWLDAVTYLYYAGQTKDYEIARSHGVYIP